MIFARPVEIKRASGWGRWSRGVIAGEPVDDRLWKRWGMFNKPVIDRLSSWERGFATRMRMKCRGKFQYSVFAYAVDEEASHRLVVPVIGLAVSF